MTANNELRKADRQIIEAHVERVATIAEYVGVLKSSDCASAEGLELGQTKLTEAKVELLAALTEAGL